MAHAGPELLVLLFCPLSSPNVKSGYKVVCTGRIVSVFSCLQNWPVLNEIIVQCSTEWVIVK